MSEPATPQEFFDLVRNIFARREEARTIALLTAAGGVMCGGLDLAHRKLCKHETIVEPNGPQILFMPCWLMGGIWIVVGIVKTILALVQTR